MSLSVVQCWDIVPVQWLINLIRGAGKRLPAPYFKFVFNIFYKHEEVYIMLKREFINWLENFYAENPVTFRIFWFLVGWFIGSTVKMAVLQHRLAKR